jgi:hypothetical protein
VDRFSPRVLRGPVWPVVLTIALTGLFATGVGGRPAGAAWDRAYDVVLYNLPYLAASIACFLAAGRVRLERFAWAGLGVALALSAVGNALRVLSAGLQGNGPSTPLSDVVSLAGYVTMYVCVIGLIRARVARFHPSMWLDGLIGAFGSLAAGSPSCSAPTSTRPRGGRPSPRPSWWARPPACCCWPCSSRSAASSVCGSTARS